MEDTKQNPDAKTPEASEKGTEGGKTFSQEDLNRVISERLVSERKKFDKELAEKLAKERAEAERLAKLTAEEKEKELTSKQMEELHKKEVELSIRENKLKAIETFDEAKIPIKLVDFVVDADAEKMEGKIKTLKETWTEALSEEVARQLKGTPPKDLGVNDQNKKVKVKTSF